MNRFEPSFYAITNKTPLAGQVKEIIRRKSSQLFRNGIVGDLIRAQNRSHQGPLAQRKTSPGLRKRRLRRAVPGSSFTGKVRPQGFG